MGENDIIEGDMLKTVKWRLEVVTVEDVEGVELGIG